MERVAKENEVSFRVSFTETQNFQEKDMKLTFFGTPSPLLLEKNPIPDINKLIQPNRGFSAISNIREVISHSNKVNTSNFQTFIVILYKELNVKNPKIENKGILIGTSKNKEQILLGLWPYSYYLELKGNYQLAYTELSEILKTPTLVSEFLFLMMTSK